MGVVPGRCRDTAVHPLTSGPKILSVLPLHRHAVGVGDDSDAQFVFLWIAFNAAYAKEFGFETTERDIFGKFIATLLSIDQNRRLHQLMFAQFTGPIRTMVENKSVFEPFARKTWNLGSDGSLWVMAPNSVDEVGCIHTCQGLEVDYIGVIIGPDLVARGGKLITQPDKRSKMDKSLSGYKSLLKTDPVEARGRADRIIRNTYRTLLTRGLKGCHVFCTDPETQAYFRQRLRR